MTLSLKKFLSTVFVGVGMIFAASAETVSGGGYSVQQIFSPIEGAISGNGYIVNQAGQSISDLISGGGYNLFSSFGTSTATSTSTSTPTSTPTQTIYTTTGGGGFYILPPSVVSTTTPSSTTPNLPVKEDTILTGNGSTCSTRIVFSSPIEINSANNKSDDVKKLERFLNTYEGERLTVNGIYEKEDVEAVKRWQKKYRSFILDPMYLKNPTGTIYTLSMRQIERQTTSSCGEPIVVTACPFFRTNVAYGDRGEAVLRVQQFLNIVQGEKLPLSGVFGPLTKNAVKRFQKTNKIYVATFIPISWATGNWYTTTRTKANETIGCDILK